jgi:transcriptional regulator with GAF, ATPase, and Fis domain
MKYAAKLGKRIETIPSEAVDDLMAYSWPGNVRELENLVERAVILTTGPRLDTSGWRLGARTPSASSVIPTLEDVQRRHILDVLELTGGRVSGKRGAADLLGVKPTTLESRMKKLGVDRRRGR